jgi:hypothetical protein
MSLLRDEPGAPPVLDGEIFHVSSEGARLIVEPDGDAVSITVRTSQHPRDAQTIVMSRRGSPWRCGMRSKASDRARLLHQLQHLQVI